MEDKQINQAIGYGIAIIFAYHLIAGFIPLLTWGVIGLVAFRIYQAHQKYKK